MMDLIDREQAGDVPDTNVGDMISRQAVIDELNDDAELLRHVLDGAYIVDVEREKFEWGLGIIESYIYDMKELPSAQPERWVPCSERLPEATHKSYWVCTDIGSQHECRWTNTSIIWTNLTTEWHWNIFDLPQYTKVVAWMPLPEPYNCGARMEADNE